MLPHIRAMVAAASYAFVTKTKVSGIHDHATGRELRIAAEARGTQLQGYDGDRGTAFGGTLPELYDAGDKLFVSLEIDGTQATGHDRSTATSYTAQVSDARVQLYDHGQSAWFNYDIRHADIAAG